MSNAILQGGASGTGQMTLLAPNTNSNQVANLPDATGTVMVSGNMPAFSAYKNGDQSISAATWTKITFTDEEFDTANCFSSSRFTPTVAGYYQISWCADLYGTSSNRQALGLYKNGATYRYSGLWAAPSGTYENEVTGSSLVYLNGTTDYIELYAYINGSGTTVYSSSAPTTTWLTGVLVRAA